MGTIEDCPKLTFPAGLEKCMPTSCKQGRSMNQTPVRIVSDHMDQQHSIEGIARVCHEANRAWCYVNGDVSQAEWAEAPAWQRESAIRGVELALANPDAPDSVLHDGWSADKVRDGWQYGPVKDTQAKTHPCLVPFDQLPAHQQAKDRLIRVIVRALANSN